MWLAWVLCVDQNLIQIHHNEGIKLFSKDLVDIALKTGWCIRKAKGHYLVLKVAISGVEGCLPFVTFSNPHSMVSTSEI